MRGSGPCDRSSNLLGAINFFKKENLCFSKSIQKRFSSVFNEFIKKPWIAVVSFLIFIFFIIPLLNLFLSKQLLDFMFGFSVLVILVSIVFTFSSYKQNTIKNSLVFKGDYYLSSVDVSAGLMQYQE